MAKGSGSAGRSGRGGTFSSYMANIERRAAAANLSPEFTQFLDILGVSPSRFRNMGRRERREVNFDFRDFRSRLIRDFRNATGYRGDLSYLDRTNPGAVDRFLYNNRGSYRP